MKKIILIVVAALMAVGAGAQDKAELKLYQKTIAKPSVKAYDKFLKKYPSSVFAEKIMFSKDSMLFEALDKSSEKAVETFLTNNKTAYFSKQAQELLTGLRTSTMTADEAMAAVWLSAPQAASVCAVPMRKYGVEYVIGAALPAEGYQIELIVLRQDAGSWIKEKDLVRDINTMMSVKSSAFVDDASLRTINSSDSKYLQFAYVNRGENEAKAEYVLNLYDFENGNVFSSIFYGNNLLKEGESGYRIEGQSPDTMIGGLVTAEQLYLNGALKDNSGLVQIAEEDAWTDEAIAWWLERNPNAQTTASSISFGVLKEDCGIVKEFKKHAKESSGGYSAALFDIRGYTVVCSKNAGQYSLVWCEPTAKNKKTDRLLNSIYFEKGSTLCLFYYKGKTTFKYRINLANKSLKR